MNIQLQDEIIKYFIENRYLECVWESFHIPRILESFSGSYLKKDIKMELILLVECYPQYMHFIETSLFVIEASGYSAVDYIKTDSVYKSHVNIHKKFFKNN